MSKVAVTPERFRHGWKDRPREVARVVSSLPHPVFGLAGPDCMGTEHRDIFFWEQGELPLLKKILGAHRQTIGDCYDGDAMILGEVTKPIKDIKIGDRVFDGQGKLTEVISIRQKTSYNPLLTIKCMGALPTKVTSDHQILAITPRLSHHEAVLATFRSSDTTRKRLNRIAETCEPVWIRANDLREGDWLLLPVDIQKTEIDFPINCESRSDLMWFFGYFLANGHASGGSVEFCVPSKRPEIGDRLVKIAQEAGLSPKIDNTETSNNAFRVRIHNKTLVGWFRQQFYQDKVKNFPLWMYGEMDAITGLYDGDGHWLQPNERVLTSTSLSVIHGIEATLVSAGHRPTVSEFHRSQDSGAYANAKPCYQIRYMLIEPAKKYSHFWHGYHARRITSITHEEGPHVVYDIGVKSEHHSFIANGTVGHNCVSHGWGRGAQDVVYMQVARNLPKEEDGEERGGGKIEPSHLSHKEWKAWKEKYRVKLLIGASRFGDVDDPTLEIATEPIYAGSRVEIGGGRIRGDGSIGGWAAKYVQQYGLLQRKAYGEYDLKTYSGQKAKQWGAPGRGVPDELEPIAKLYPVRTVSLVVTDDEAAAALYNMYPIPVCSGQGFTMSRDKYGFCDPRGSWAHCMVARGICLAKRAGNFVLAVVIQQSWGESPTGPNKVELKSGRTVELPQGCFLIEMDVFARMLRGRDSFAISDAEGFVPRMPNFTL